MNKVEILNKNLIEIKTKVYDKLSLKISEIYNEIEGTKYDACQFELNGMKIISRSSKITPKKMGQFVTFWQRNLEGITQPYSEKDQFDFYIINVKNETHFGQFVFPKSELSNKGIITTAKKDGKRGFRIYPKWDKAQNNQAKRTQKWQLNYFYEVDENIDLKKVNKLYQRKQHTTNNQIR